MHVERDAANGARRGHRMLVTNAGNAVDIRAITAFVVLIALTAMSVLGAIEFGGFLGAASTILAIGFGFCLSMIVVAVLVPLVIVRLGRRRSGT